MDTDKRILFAREDKQLILKFNKDPASITFKEAREELTKQGFFMEKGKDIGADYRFVYPEVEKMQTVLDNC